MSDNPTSVQYRLGVEIGHLVVKAMGDGATYDEIIDTLGHSIDIAARNKAMGVPLAKVPGNGDGK